MDSLCSFIGCWLVAHDILENRYIDNVKFSFSCPNQWRSQDFSEEEAIVTTQLYGGVGGHAPPGNFLKFGPLKWHFLHFESTFEQNILV